MRPEPRIPSEVLLAAGLDQYLARALADEDARGVAVPVCETAFRLRRAVEHRVRERAEPFAARRLEEPLDVRTGEVPELVEAERDILDDQPLVALRARGLELVARDL